jgi:hypothetical protein
MLLKKLNYKLILLHKIICRSFIKVFLSVLICTKKYWDLLFNVILLVYNSIIYFKDKHYITNIFNKKLYQFFTKFEITQHLETKYVHTDY